MGYQPLSLRKDLGQHFLKTKKIAIRIVNLIQKDSEVKKIIEVGPGGGALTEHLIKKGFSDKLLLVELDERFILHLTNHFPILANRIIKKDILQFNPKNYQAHPFVLVGNLPYNISNQLFWRAFTWRESLCEMVCMIQKEVAERISSPPGSKKYGILSVLLQAFYTIEYCFTVPPEAFTPPPRVNSGVIRCVRNQRSHLPCDEKQFTKVVKTAFAQRRKVLRNSLSSLNINKVDLGRYKHMRPEQLAVEDFISLTMQLFA